MKPIPSVTAALLVFAASAALALQAGEVEPRRVAPGSHWWISDAQCLITGNFGSPEALTSLSIEPTRDGQYRLEVFNNQWRDLPVDTDIQAGVGFDGGARIPSGEAFGFPVDDGGQVLRFWIDGALIERFDDHRELDVYRDATRLTSIRLEGSAPAIAAMKACNAAFEEAERLRSDPTGNDMPMDMNLLDGSTVTEVEAALENEAAALEESMENEVPEVR